MKKLIFLATILFSCSRNNCDVVVELENGDIIRSRYVQTYVSGVSNIKKCDGSDFQINTSNIKQVSYH